MRNVIFDLGGVLLEWNPDAILEGYYSDAGARAVMKAALFKHPDWLQLDRGTLAESDALAAAAAANRPPGRRVAGAVRCGAQVAHAQSR